VKEALVSIRYRKPNKYEFVRVRPEEEYHLQTYVIELKNDNELFLVDRLLWPSLAGEPTFGPRAFYTAINRQGELFLWPCLLPKPDGKVPDWVAIPLEAAQKAMRNWTKIAWDDSQKRHRIWEATAQLPEPEWPNLPFNQILKLGFRDHFISSPDHQVLRRLRGEV
jgi:hypothetical protein